MHKVGIYHVKDDTFWQDLKNRIFPQSQTYYFPSLNFDKNAHKILIDLKILLHSGTSNKIHDRYIPRFLALFYVFFWIT